MRIACVLFSNVSHQLCTNPNEIIDPKQHTIHSAAPIAVPPKSLADSAPRFKDPNGAGVGISPNSATSPELLDMPCGPVKPSAPPSLTNSATLGKDAPPPTLNENDGSPSSNPEATPGILKRFLSGDPSGVVPWDR
ncbi:hypothetical protein BCR44DRAFT_1436797 [Catenaria anguillulae PL171]|uniref:Uncharacterized protein n=1 Tax=Catenaria anguillulae PL171 TaxID=765915 RepID=A0A1Y2HKJ6_9FUNG|nr:hypothetical protein BCR44DRAFT_1436797 [Catenaria anguillulae PL171]